jgi:hypothetical protein
MTVLLRKEQEEKGRSCLLALEAEEGGMDSDAG